MEVPDSTEPIPNFENVAAISKSHRIPEQIQDNTLILLQLHSKASLPSSLSFALIPVYPLKMYKTITPYHPSFVSCHPAEYLPNGHGLCNDTKIPLVSPSVDMTYFLLLWFLWCDMPVTPQVPINGNRIIQIHGEHSSRCPAIQQPSIWRITSVRIPNWCKMRSSLIGTVTIFLKLMGHIIADIHPLQKPPKPLILKFRKISHRILRRCHCRTLIGADMSCYLFLESITGFHRPSRSSRGLFIGCNSHICIQACGISIQIKLPPAMVTPVPVIILIPAVPYPVFPPPWSPHTPGCRGYFCIGRNRRSCKLVIPGL